MTILDLVLISLDEYVTASCHAKGMIQNSGQPPAGQGKGWQQWRGNRLIRG